MVDLIFNDTMPIMPMINYTGEIVSYKAQDILHCEMWTNICREGKTAVRNTTCTISKLLQLISAGYTVIPCKTSPKFCQQILLLRYNYSDEKEIEPIAFNKKIMPTFIINHEQPCYYSVSSAEKQAILGYCFNEPIRSKTLMKAISTRLLSRLDNYNYWGNYELKSYCSNYFTTKVTGITISNNIYIPVEGDVSYGE